MAMRAKVKEIIESVEDTNVQELMKKNLLICGGAIASMLSNERPKDFDLYFRDLDTCKAVADYYTEQFNKTKGQLKTTAIASCNPYAKIITAPNIRGEMENRVVIYIKSAGVAGEEQTEYRYFEGEAGQNTEDFAASLQYGDQDPEQQSASEFMDTNVPDPMVDAEQLKQDLRGHKKKFRPVFFSDNAITLSDRVQMVMRFYGEPDEIYKNYDYAHSMCSYDYAADVLNLHPEAMESILGKNLIYRGSLYPICSLFRMRKFMRRGWSITAGQILKIVWQVNELDLKNPRVLREQLIGVDTAYMFQLIQAISAAEPGTKIDSTYIASIVDTIFD
jgi:hypothetical protein